MKKLILTLGIFLSGVLLVQAQTSQATLDKRTNGFTGKITKACNLTPDQVTKVTPFVAQYVQTRAANKQKFANDPTGLKTANQSNFKSLKANLQTVLSADQMTQYSALAQKVHAAHAAKAAAQTATPAQK